MPISRRSLLKSFGVASGAALLADFPLDVLATARPILEEAYPFSPYQPKKTITAITLGAGSRGNVYGGYALQFPNALDIVGVAEPNPVRNERYSKSIKLITKTGSTPGRMSSKYPNLQTR